MKTMCERVVGKFFMFYTIYLYHCCSINGTYCCSGYRWSKIQNNCIRKCNSYNNAIDIVLNCKFKKVHFDQTYTYPFLKPVHQVIQE